MSVSSSDSFSDLASVKSSDSSSFDAVIKAKLASAEEMTAQTLKIESVIRHLTEKWDIAEKKEVQEDILANISGSWDMVDSIGVPEYLAKLKEVTKNDLWCAIFEIGCQNFEFDKASKKLTSCETLGSQEHFKREAKLGKRTTSNGQTTMTFSEGNSLVTAFFLDSGVEEFAREERFMKDGQLYIVTKRFGMKCTRIYEKDEDEDSDEDSEDEVDCEELQKRIEELEAEVEGEKAKRKESEELVQELKQDFINLMQSQPPLVNLTALKSIQDKIPRNFCKESLGYWEKSTETPGEKQLHFFMKEETLYERIEHSMVALKDCPWVGRDCRRKPGRYTNYFSQQYAFSKDYDHKRSKDVTKIRIIVDSKMIVFRIYDDTHQMDVYNKKNVK